MKTIELECPYYLKIVFLMKSFAIDPANPSLDTLIYGNGDFENSQDALIRSLMPMLLSRQPLRSTSSEDSHFHQLVEIDRQKITLTLHEETADILTITSAEIV